MDIEKTYFPLNLLIQDELEAIGVDVPNFDIGLYYDPDEVNFYFNDNGLFFKLKIYFSEQFSIDIPFLKNSKIIFANEINQLTSYQIEITSEPFEFKIFDIDIILNLSSEYFQAYQKYDQSGKEVTNDSLNGHWKKKKNTQGYGIAFKNVEMGFNSINKFWLNGPKLDQLSPVMIGQTGFIIAAEGLDFITDNIPDDLVDTVPQNFSGVYIKSATCYYSKSDAQSSIPPFSIQNALIGSGGFTGKTIVGNATKEIGFTEEQLNKDFSIGENNNSDALATRDSFNQGFKFNKDYFGQIKLQGFNVAIWQLSLSFTNSIPDQFSISGAMNMPLGNSEGRWLIFKANIGGPNGDIFIEVGGLPGDPLINIETDWYKVEVDTIAYKYEADVHYAIINGGVQLKIEPLDLPLLKVDGLSVGSDGSMDIDGGWAEFPETVSIDLGGFKINLTEMGMGTEGEIEQGDTLRQWFGFSGGINLLQGAKGGASVEGLKVSWDKDTGDHMHVTLRGIAVDLEVPETFTIKGKISYDEETNLFRGMVDIEIISIKLKVHGELIVGKTRDDTGREFSVFYIALKGKSKMGVPLGGTGLSLFGLAGLYGQNVAPTKTEQQTWFEWYQSHPAYNMISVDKWDARFGHHAFGVGVNIGTSYDSGTTFNADIMLAVLTPGPVIMFEGQAQLLSTLDVSGINLPDNNLANQVSKNTENSEDAKTEPVEKKQMGNMYMLAVYDGNKGTFSLNIDIKYVIQELISLGGSLAAFFDFNDPNNWYIHIGVKDPVSKRIHAEVLAVFSASAYFMIDPNSMRLGAAVVWGFDAEYGPVQVVFKTAFSFDALIIYNPFQTEAELTFLAELGIRVFCFDFGLLLDALLQVSAPKPYWIYGLIKVRLGLPWPLPSPEFDIDFDWKEKPLPQPPQPLLTAIEFVHHKTKDFSIPLTIVVSQETLPKQLDTSINWDNIAIVPIDARPILSFAKQLSNDHQLGSRFMAKRNAQLIPEAINFQYEIVDDEQDQVTLEVLDENDQWVTVKKGFGSGQTDKFTLNRDSYVNGIDAQAPQIQLWQYRPLDMAPYLSADKAVHLNIHCQKFSNEGGYLIFENEELEKVSDLSARCRNVLIRANKPMSIRRGTENFDDHLFVQSSDVVDSGGQSLSLVDLSLSLPMRSNEVSLFIFKTNIEKLILLNNGLELLESDYDYTIDVTDRMVYQIPIMLLVIKSQYHIFDHISIKTSRFDNSEASENLAHLNVIFQSVNSFGLLAMYYQRRHYSQYKPLKSSVKKTNHVTQNEEVSSTYLLPGRKYRLSVPTMTTISGRNHGVIVRSYCYFQTDYGPGLTMPEKDNYSYKDLPFHQFENSLLATSPNNGAKNHYHQYDVLVQFNEAYLKTLFADRLKLVVMDQNYKIISEIEQGIWLDIDEIQPLIHQDTVTQSVAISTNGKCVAIRISAIPTLTFPLNGLRGNRRYFCKIQCKRTENAVYEDVHDFEFITSQYCSLTEHLTGQRHVPDEWPLKTMYVPDLVDLDSFITPDDLKNAAHNLIMVSQSYEKALENYKALVSPSSGKPSAIVENVALAIDKLHADALLKHQYSTELFNKIDRCVDQFFEKFRPPMTRMLPTRFEMLILQHVPENINHLFRGTELARYLLLFESPEPIDWERLSASLSGQTQSIVKSDTLTREEMVDIIKFSEQEENVLNSSIHKNMERYNLFHPRYDNDAIFKDIDVQGLKYTRKKLIKKVVDSSHLNHVDLLNLYHHIHVTETKEFHSQLMFIWNHDKTKAFILLPNSITESEVSTVFINSGKYKINFSFVGDQNPEIGLLLKDNNVVHENFTASFEIK